MKKIIYLFTIVGIMAFLGSCTEDIREPLFKDSQPPGPVSNVTVVNSPGGALITYTLPSDNDVLYVKAVYMLSNNRKVETRSSAYINQLVVEGFNDTSESTVTLYAVDRSENASTPVTVKVNPLTPDVHSVRETVTMVPDFGGVLYRWTNENNAPLAFLILAPDKDGILQEVETVYSGMTAGAFTVRGFEPEEGVFGVVIRDRWDNYSDTIKLTLTPMLEKKLDKRKFQKIVLSNDHDMAAWEGKYEFAYDENPATFIHTWAGSGWPQMWTLDLGVVARLSRVNVLQRQNFYYSHGNPRLLEIWGMKETPDQDGSFTRWTKLRDCVAIRPSLLGGTAAEDQEHFAKGDEFSFTLDDPAVRYIRFVVNETWGKTGFIHFAEVSFWGQEINE